MAFEPGHTLWKTDNNNGGRKASRKLFRQFDPEGTEDLEEWRKTFVEICDPTEYQAALALIGSWPEWQRFKRDWKEFANVILPNWLAEVEVKLRSEAVRNLVLKGAQDANSAKWLAEGKFRLRAAGKPSKAEIEHAAKVEAGLMSEVEEDILRVKGIAEVK